MKCSGTKTAIAEILVREREPEGRDTGPSERFHTLVRKKSRKASGGSRSGLSTNPENSELLRTFRLWNFRLVSEGRVTELEATDRANYTGDVAAFRQKYPGAILFAANPLKSGENRPSTIARFPFSREGPSLSKPGQCWKHTVKEDDGSTGGNVPPRYGRQASSPATDVRFVRHTPTPSSAKSRTGGWIWRSAQSGSTSCRPTSGSVQRCFLMATIGDIVLDPTCRFRNDCLRR